MAIVFLQIYNKVSKGGYFLCFYLISVSLALSFRTYKTKFMRFIWIILLSFSFLQAQNLPENYFKSPLDIPLVLSGTFGELRGNHFHSGLDIKTQQRTGLKVLASASGYVSRIKISHWGYGKALYVTHPNGYTSVYAHLNHFNKEIEAYIKKRQYAKESFEIEVFPEANRLQVKQGEVIAYSGNTGGSGGPHLHFEIRDGKSRPMNPMLFGFDIKDTYKPEISDLFAYTANDTSYINGKNGRQKLRLIPLENGDYTTENIKAYGKIGFGISSIDKLNYAPNKNGVNHIQTSLNGNTCLAVDFNKFSFSETRYLNQYIDYEYYIENKSRVQKLFIEPNNPLSIFKENKDNGYLEIKEGLSYNYLIKVKDFKGNTSSIRVPITPKKDSSYYFSPQKKQTSYLAKRNHASVFDIEDVDIYIPKNALYEDTYLAIKKEEENYQIHHRTTPLHYNITIGFDVSQYTEADKEKLFIARLSDWGKPYYSRTYKKANRFTTKTRSFGTYKLVADNAPPLITPVNFRNKKWMSNYRYLKFKIEDDLSGIQSYRATINGKFILMEYDYKTDLLTFDFNDNIVTETENNLKLIVIDNVGNTTTFEGTFYRKTK